MTGVEGPFYLRAPGRDHAPPPRSPIRSRWCADPAQTAGLRPPAPGAGGRLRGNDRSEGKARGGQRAGPTGTQDAIRLLLAAATRKEGTSF